MTRLCLAALAAAALAAPALLGGCSQAYSLRWRDVGNEVKSSEDTLQPSESDRLQKERIKVFFVDERPYPHEKFGENVQTGRVFLTDQDVTAWVADHWSGMLVGWGFTLVDRGETLRVKATLKKALVTESSAFNGEVIIHYSVIRPDGSQLWQGTLSSRADTRGRTENVENYFKVLSLAVARSARDFVNSPLLAVLR